jgi:zinc transport system substrate-binding protein
VYFAKAEIKIVSTVKPIADIVKAVGGNKVKSEYIIPPNVSFHMYEYSIKDMKKVSSANIFVYIGSGEPNINNLLKIAKGEKLKVGALRGMLLIKDFEFTGLEAKDEGHNHRDKHHRHNEEFHPAVWLDPVNALIIAVNIKNKLQRLDPKNKNYYEKNYLKFQNRVVSVFNKWYWKFNKLKRKDFISYHYLWPYLTYRFKLNYLAVIELGHGREPSIHHITYIINLIKNRDVKAIFVAKQFENKKYTKIITESTGVKIVYLDPFGINKDYPSMMDFNLRNIYKGLSGN